MPELAEVVYFAHRWDAGRGQRIVRVHAHARSRVFRGGNANLLGKALADKKYLRPFTHGKNMLFQFSGGVWLGGHLGMTGELQAASPNHSPQKHEHLVLFTAAAALVYRDPRMFGRWRLDRGAEPPSWWRALPPEIMSREFSADYLAKILRRRAGTPLKVLLLEQSVFPGIGNWMADEVLWQMRIHPSTPAGAGEAAALRKTLRLVCQGALRTVGRDWSDPPKKWLFHQRWKTGGRCPRCHATLTRAAFRSRTACWCPDCQDGRA
jgi:formamidopyrimidine-DNA glycosylase